MDYKITKLKRNGPKPGQSTESWLRGKKQDIHLREAERRVNAVDELNSKKTEPR